MACSGGAFCDEQHEEKNQRGMCVSHGILHGMWSAAKAQHATRGTSFLGASPRPSHGTRLKRPHLNYTGTTYVPSNTPHPLSVALTFYGYSDIPGPELPGAPQTFFVRQTPPD
ncbi:hypothetical protein NDU88_005910 [Pleurodeles waltl]|uniref:Uncharacterized protein n=1 Tax=Pleurodeles waltl TaxID=8319 RepID=A0AAV7MKU0_PLEWA|nr:hypothetical protein NDU88_005910 [Pleurodeles waltl]